jgi:hypothetical protein
LLLSLAASRQKPSASDKNLDRNHPTTRQKPSDMPRQKQSFKSVKRHLLG